MIFACHDDVTPYRSQEEAVMICCRAKRVCNVKEEAAADGDMPELRGGCGPPGPLSLGASYGGLFRAVLGSDIGAKSAF